MRRLEPYVVAVFATAPMVACAGERPVEPVPPPGSDSVVSTTAGVIPGQYIIVFRDDVGRPDELAAHLSRTHGLGRRHLYRHSIKGFSAVVPQGRLRALQEHPRVWLVQPNTYRSLQLQRAPRLAAGGRGFAIQRRQGPSATLVGVTRVGPDTTRYRECLDEGNHDQLNGSVDLWNIGRVKADQNPTWLSAASPGCEITVHFFDIDTGVDSGHPDLNVLEVTNFVAWEPERSGEDGHGHGTHTAGIAAARNGNGGAVGVAPGAPIHAYRVCTDQGFCADDDILAAVDAVTGWKRANPGQDGVANMSLGGYLGDALEAAIRRSVNAGVVYAVSAGNGREGWCFTPGPADLVSPARLGDDDINADDESNGDARPLNGIITTTASDRFDRDVNCNFGHPVTVAAPGWGVTSTWLLGGYRTLSGTSMAAPHAAGAAILYLHRHPGASPTEVESAIVDALDPWFTDDLPNARGRLNVESF